MPKTIRILLFNLLSILILIHQSNQQSSALQSNNIVFDLADLSVDYESDAEWISLEAFKSAANDAIIKEGETSKYGQLNWLSIGFPRLVPFQERSRNSSEFKPKLFKFTSEGFSVGIEMLTNEYREYLSRMVLRKYKIPVIREQIVSLIPSKFECKFNLYENGINSFFKGEARQLNRFPLTVFFAAPVGTSEREMFENAYKKQNEKIDITILCDFYSQGRSYRENTLIISASQVNKLGLSDKIFGTGQEAYVTRNQVSSLSTELYQKLNIFEDYQISETQFKENFINDFIKQTADSVLAYVSIDEALSNLSQYNMQADLKPSVIKEELSKVLFINRTEKTSLVQVNRTFFQSRSSSSNSNSDSSFGLNATFQAIPIGFNFNDDSSSSSSNSETKFYASVDNQLNKLNSYVQSDIEWARKGDIIVPKSIRVSKLGRANFMKNLLFSRVKREYYEAAYKRTLELNTVTVKYKLRVSDRAADLENQMKLLQSNLETSLNNQIGSLKADQSVFKNKLDNTISNLESTLTSSTKTIQGSLTNLDASTTQNFVNVRNDVNSRISSLSNELNSFKSNYKQGLSWCEDYTPRCPAKPPAPCFRIRDPACQRYIRG